MTDRYPVMLHKSSVGRFAIVPCSIVLYAYDIHKGGHAYSVASSC